MSEVMWEKIWDAITKIITLTEKTDRNTQDIKELQRGFRDLTVVVQLLYKEIHNVRDEDRHEREKMALRLENELLKFERRLPSGKE